jgi:hypothetical protein
MTLSIDAIQRGIGHAATWQVWQHGELADQQLQSGTIMLDTPLPTATPACVPTVAVHARNSAAESRKHLDR